MEYDLDARWYAVEDTDLGGWCIADGPNPFRRPIEGNILASVNGEDVARHIANIHNAATSGEPQLDPSTIFAGFESTEVYRVFCTEKSWAHISEAFNNIDSALRFLNGLPVNSGRQMKKRYTFVKEVDA